MKLFKTIIILSILAFLFTAVNVLIVNAAGTAGPCDPCTANCPADPNCDITTQTCPYLPKPANCPAGGTPTSKPCDPNNPASGYCLPNPLQTTSVFDLAGRIIKAVFGVTGVIALIMFIWGGMLWMFSGGSPDKVKRGRDTLVWATLGIVIIFASYAIMDFLLGKLLG